MLRPAPAFLIVVFAACGPPASPAALAPTMPPEAAPPAPRQLELEAEEIVASPAYPPAPRDEVVETLHGVEVPDPYRWLEDASAAAVNEWATAQDGLARARLAKLPARAELASRVAELSYYDSVSPPEVRGGRWFYKRRHKDREKAVLYWRDGEAGDERVLLDPNTWSRDGSASLDGYFPSWDGRFVAYKRAENNADEAVLHVREVATGAELPADRLRGLRYGSVSWTADSRALYYTYYPTDPSIAPDQRPGLAEIRLHRLAKPQAEDELIMPATGSPQLSLGLWAPRQGRFLVLSVSVGWNATDVYIKDLRRRRSRTARDPSEPAANPRERMQQLAIARGFQPLIVGRDAITEAMVWNGWIYVRSNDGAPTFRLFRVNPRRLERRRWREIVPARTDVLDAASIIGNKLALVYKRDAASAIELRELDGRPFRDVELPGLGTAGLYGAPDRDTAYLSFSSFDHPRQVQATSIRTGDRSLWGKVELPFDPTSLRVERAWYTSKDGTRISMFVVSRADLERDGKRPTVIHGYGGFSIDMMPRFSPFAVALAERGGVYAVPHLRGGGEYGESWHRAGMLEVKQNVFDDAVAAAEHLIRQSYASPSTLAIKGGSNGGLLVGAVLTQRPELFGAAICQVPLLDMVRYHLSGGGRTWIPEYGDPDDAAAFAWLHAYSPYHRLERGTAYPAFLMMAADSDDRVDPLHARKFTAALQWASTGGPVLMRVERNAGHGGADLVRSSVESTVDQLAFVLWQLTTDDP